MVVHRESTCVFCSGESCHPCSHNLILLRRCQHAADERHGERACSDEREYYERCQGCGATIEPGEHLITARIELGTQTDRHRQQVRQLRPTVLEALVHGPLCLALWIGENPIIENVFARR